MSIPINRLNYKADLANTYVVGFEGQPAFVIDPSYNKNGVLENYLSKHHSGLLGILITHGHYDHILGLKDFKGLDKTPLFMGSDDIICLSDSKFNVSNELFDDPLILEGLNPYPLEDGDEIKLGTFIIKAIATPFHTRGSFCFYLEESKVLFSGDSLFHLGVGRSDLPGSCPREMEDSLAKLKALPDETVVYPGHGPKTLIGDEKRYNPYFLSK